MKDRDNIFKFNLNNDSYIASSNVNNILNVDLNEENNNEINRIQNPNLLFDNLNQDNQNNINMPNPNLNPNPNVNNNNFALSEISDLFDDGVNNLSVMHENIQRVPNLDVSRIAHESTNVSQERIINNFNNALNAQQNALNQQLEIVADLIKNTNERIQKTAEDVKKIADNLNDNSWSSFFSQPLFISSALLLLAGGVYFLFKKSNSESSISNNLPNEGSNNEISSVVDDVLEEQKNLRNSISGSSQNLPVQNNSPSPHYFTSQWVSFFFGTGFGGSLARFWNIIKRWKKL